MAAAGVDASHDIGGMYGIQFRRRIAKGSAPRQQTFLTFGLVGLFMRAHEPEHRYTRSDGSMAVSPAHTDSLIIPPLFGVIGGGIQRPLTRPPGASRRRPGCHGVRYADRHPRGGGHLRSDWPAHASHSAGRIEMRPSR